MMKNLRIPLSTVTLLALLVGLLSFGAFGSTAASAAPVSASCSAARADTAKKVTLRAERRKDVRRARVNVQRARKALQKARKAKAPARIKNAKKRVKRASQVRVNTTKRYKTAVRRANTAQQNRTRACSTPPAQSPGITQQQFDQLIALFTSISEGQVNQEQIEQFLAIYFAELGLDAGEIADLVDQLNSLNDAQLARVAQLVALLESFGDQLDNAQLQQLLIQIRAIIEGASGDDLLSGGLVGLILDLTDTITDVLDEVGLEAVGNLLQVLLVGLVDGGDLSNLNLAQFTNILNQFLPGLAGEFTNGELLSLLEIVTGPTGDPADLLESLGGALSLAQLQQILGGTASDALLQQVVAPLTAALQGLIPTQLGTPGPLSGLLGLLCGILPICR